MNEDIDLTHQNVGIAHVLKFFAFAHLRGPRQEVSKPFAVLASKVARLGGDAGNPKVTVALWKLLEAKDAAVRSVLP